MSTTYKVFTENDHTNVKTNIHEGVPITGTLVSGTYDDENIKNYGHLMFQSVYDYPYLSASANAVLDISAGYSADSALSASVNEQNSKKINIYNQFAKVLVGNDTDGEILRFDQDGNIAEGGSKLDECMFLVFDRSLFKDEIKKDSFRFTMYTGAYSTEENFGDPIALGDYGASTAYKTNSPAGEYGILYTSSATPNEDSGFGLVYYQAGVVVVSGSFFDAGIMGGDTDDFSSLGSFESILTGSTIDIISNELRHRWDDMDYSNTTELHSSVYFVRLNHNEFNYSSNPTYLDDSKIVTKNKKTDNPTSYVTGVGLYAPDGELLAVAKLSEPIKKTSDNEVTLRVRLDY